MLTCPSHATEEHRNNEQVDMASKIEVVQVDLDWKHKGKLYVAPWPMKHQNI